MSSILKVGTAGLNRMETKHLFFCDLLAVAHTHGPIRHEPQRASCLASLIFPSGSGPQTSAARSISYGGEARPAVGVRLGGAGNDHRGSGGGPRSSQAVTGRRVSLRNWRRSFYALRTVRWDGTYVTAPHIPCLPLFRRLNPGEQLCNFGRGRRIATAKKNRPCLL
jgi:hypothetical protein